MISVNILTGIYEYDSNGTGNGNVTKDGRNGMTLSYNYLNLPITANKAGASLSYTYNSAGEKLTKNYNGSLRQYVRGIEYKPGGTIELIHT